MGPTSPTSRTLCSRHEALLNASTQLEAENLHYLRDARHLLARKKIIKGNIILKLRKKMQPMPATHCHKLCKKQLVASGPIPASNLVTTCYPYQQDYNYPLTMNDWPQPLFSAVPVIIPSTTQVFATHLTPVIGTVVQPLLSPVIPQYAQDDAGNITNYGQEYGFCTEQTDEISNEQTYYVQDEVLSTLNTTADVSEVENQDPVESYLKLPKELFPTPNMLAVDPNPIIDEFCKMPNLQRHMPWILDLEFGIPKSPITRPIPTYNVKFNSIHCKNAPDAIHPGFESCDPDFKRVLLFYYDCIVSAWYRGYMIMHCDRSVENFQSWLLLPMQVLGMCWP
ncbi:uncharacterized protein LOC142976037 [Anticarsia gemmatalis]|uniref:uncharacterized protein LOC142976037 n=1 Tax=Anticarsia gemmatalis TaxID=129554 RepID=UPI003F758B42